MTKTEYTKFEKMMEEAIRKAKQSNEEYKVYNQLWNEYRITEAETEQRKADQHYGESIGINKVLVTLGFKHGRMKELSDLL